MLREHRVEDALDTVSRFGSHEYEISEKPKSGERGPRASTSGLPVTCAPLIAMSSLLLWVQKRRLCFSQQFGSILGGKGFNLLNKLSLLLLI